MSTSPIAYGNAPIAAKSTTRLPETLTAAFRPARLGKTSRTIGAVLTAVNPALHSNLLPKDKETRMAQIAAPSPAQRESRRIPRHEANIIVDPEAHADGRLLDTLAKLRRDQPIAFAEADDVDPFWIITRQEHLRWIAMRPDTFTNGGRNQTLVTRSATRQMQEMLAGQSWPVRTIVQMDPPDHQKYRAVAAEFFHARNLDTLTETIRAIARDFVSRLLAYGDYCDFAQQIAFNYPLHVIMRILGVPAEDEPLMLRLTQEFFGVSDTELARGGQSATNAGAGEALVNVTAEFNAYFDRMMAVRRTAPRSDLMSVIATARIDGEPMPELEARSYCFVAATAGHDTTAAVTAGGMLALCENPGLLDEIRGDPEKIRAFVEEATRIHSPAKITMRTAAADAVVGDTAITQGDWIAMAWASGNRDEALFEDPDTFRIDRKPNKLISYGNGPHVCIGQHLARLEMRLFFEELTDRIADVELAGTPRSMASLMVSGLKSLPIRFKPRV